MDTSSSQNDRSRRCCSASLSYRFLVQDRRTLRLAGRNAQVRAAPGTASIVAAGGAKCCRNARLVRPESPATPAIQGTGRHRFSEFVRRRSAPDPAPGMGPLGNHRGDVARAKTNVGAVRDVWGIHEHFYLPFAKSQTTNLAVLGAASHRRSACSPSPSVSRRDPRPSSSTIICQAASPKPYLEWVGRSWAPPGRRLSRDLIERMSFRVATVSQGGGVTMALPSADTEHRCDS